MSLINTKLKLKKNNNKKSKSKSTALLEVIFLGGRNIILIFSKTIYSEIITIRKKKISFKMGMNSLTFYFLSIYGGLKKKFGHFSPEKTIPIKLKNYN